MTNQQDDNKDDALNELQQKIKEQEAEQENEAARNEKEASANEDVTDVNGQDSRIAQLTQVAQQATADLANFKRRSEEEKKAFGQFATANLVSQLLQVTDNFDRALQNIPEGLEGSEWTQGIQGIDQQFHGILERQGVKPIEAVGQKLDLNLHEALMQGPGEKDIVLEELEKGYMMGDKVLRPTKVKVGNGETA